MALRLGDQAVYLQDIAAHSLRQIKLIDDLSDVLQISVDMRMGMTVGMLTMVMVRMIMLMTVTMVMTFVIVVMAVNVVMAVVVVIMAVHMILVVTVVMVMMVVIVIMLMTVVVIIMTVAVAVVMVMAVIMVMADVVSVLMMLVRMGVYVQTLLFLSADCHFQMGSADPAFFNRFLFKGHSGNTQGIQSVNHGGRIGIEFQQGCGEHISGRPHVTFKI